MRFLNLEYFWVRIYEFLTGNKAVPGKDYFFDFILPILKTISTVVILLSLIVLIYALFRRYEILKEENEKYGFYGKTDGEYEIKNQKWEHIQELLQSESTNDWRQAIIEADILLDDLVTRMGYHGEGLGEKLKMVEKADFQTIDNAWEGHKVRNRIAHEGSDFILTQREARRVVDLFKTVFQEFGYLPAH